MYKFFQLFQGATVLNSCNGNPLCLPNGGKGDDVALGFNTAFRISTGKAPGHQPLQSNLCRSIHQPHLVQKLYHLGYAVQEAK